MNNKSIVIGVIVLIVLAAVIAGVSMYSNKPAVVQNDMTIVDDTVKPAEKVDLPTEQKVSKSFNELLSGGGNTECTFLTNEEGSQMDGLLFTNGTMLRGDYQVKSPEMTVSGHMIMRDGYMYSWIDTMPNGMKIKLDAEKKADATDKTSLDADKKVDMTCKPWSAESTKFELPVDRQFDDISALVNPTTSTDTEGTNTNTSQCAVCDSLQDATQKTQCKNALGCK